MSAEIRFMAPTPAPLTLTPVDPADAATAPEITTASISCFPSASTVRVPSADTLESRR